MNITSIQFICPNCGKANDCQIAGDRTCWCFEAIVDRAKLDEAIEGKPNSQCLCSNCLSKLQ
ncbi:cysteine-rich CWC family protein [Polynucleobacter sp.]|uniref:cysteine-rich CWC family protein n=1 Tax=Polynucleobacter sp. TaxID=2029855 RepID=UPI00351D4B92